VLGEGLGKDGCACTYEPGFEENDVPSIRSYLRERQCNPSLPLPSAPAASAEEPLLGKDTVGAKESSSVEVAI
jgi:hypothetical protein